MTSSAFYWPYSFADGDPLDYVHDSEKENDDFVISNKCVMRCRAWHFFSAKRHFTQVDLDGSKKTLQVRTFGKAGQQLDRRDSKTRLVLGVVHLFGCSN